MTSELSTSRLGTYDLWAVAGAVVIAVGIALLTGLKSKRERPPAYIGDREDVTSLVRSAGMEKRAIWEVFDGLAKKYGMHAHLEAFGQRIFLINYMIGDVCSFELGGKSIVGTS